VGTVEKMVSIIGNFLHTLEILWQVCYVDDWFVLCQFLCLPQTEGQKYSKGKKFEENYHFLQNCTY
jgi:hypothetical protein